MSGYPKVIGYLRVITQDQDMEKNKAAILSFANDRKLGPVEWLEEKVSGVNHGASGRSPRLPATALARRDLYPQDIAGLSRDPLD